MNSATVLEIYAQADATGEARVSLPVSSGCIHSIAVVADSTDAPDANWDIQLLEYGEADLLNSQLLNLSATENSVYYPYQEAATSSGSNAIWLRSSLELYFSNMGAGKACSVIFFVTPGDMSIRTGSGRSDAGTEVVSVTADYTVTTENVVLVDASSAAVTITLPAVSSGRTLSVKKIDSSGNTVTVATPGSETIDGQATKIISFAYTNIALTCDGTEWFIL